MKLRAPSVPPRTPAEWDRWTRSVDIRLGNGENVEDAINSKAPKDAVFLVGAGSTALTAERLVTDTATIAWDFGTLGQAQASLSYVRSAAEIAASVIPSDFSILPYYGKRYGIDVTGATDSTSAVQRMVDAAVKEYHHTCTLPHGIIRIDGQITVHEGVTIRAPGSVGSTSSYGCTILHHSNGNLFVFDASGTAFAGTGGGLENLLILKQNGFSGGYAVHIIGADDQHRPGEMYLHRLLVAHTGSGLWARGINIDGSALTTPGSKGIRRCRLDAVRVASCTDSLRYISLTQVTHLTATDLQVDAGTGTGTVGMTIDGDSENVSITGAVINGELEIGGNSTHINIQGRVSTFDQNYSSCEGTFVGSGATVTNNSKNFRIVHPRVASFRVRLTSDVDDETGDGTAYTILFDDEDFDVAGNYDTGTGRFTCTQAGPHLFKARVIFNDVTSAVTRLDVHMIHKNSGGTELDRTTSAYTLTWPVVGNGYVTVEASELFSLAEGDTVEVVAVATGTTKTIDIEGSDLATSFSGKLLS